MKYKNILKEAMRSFEVVGIVPLFPNLDYGSKSNDDSITIEEKKKLALEHYTAIDVADKVYFITQEGYMGTSLKLELGYAIAKGKQIYFSEPTGDIGLDCYVEEFVQTDNLKRFFVGGV
jgi:nucleoside 2-deoxyribosyltransferase